MKKSTLRIQHRMCIWVLQEKRKFWFITYWKDIAVSAFLHEMEEKAEFITKSQNL